MTVWWIPEGKGAGECQRRWWGNQTHGDGKRTVGGECTIQCIGDVLQK